MDIELHNTLTRKKEKFTPLQHGLFSKPTIGMYNCGPTVYNYAHIGNLRAYVFADTLKRLMKANGYKVKQVINITDVGHLTSEADSGEDKIEKASEREHKSAWDIAKFYTDAFFEDLTLLNIDTQGTKFPRATDYISEQIKIIKTLETKGFTYRTSDGIYFDTSKFPGYGKLGGLYGMGKDLKIDNQLNLSSRIGLDNEKRNQRDFALWKFSPKGEKRDMEWPSPWGVGFPGWHIECSAMSRALLGETFDIHTGGIDHIPTHHNNEIAQSEGSQGKPFVRYWMHNAFINIQGEKMAKSDENFITLQSVKEKGYSPLAYRYFLLGARYSTPLNFTWQALDGAANAYKKLITAVCELPLGGKVNKEIWNRALGFVADDLDTPKVLALCWDLLKDDKLSPADKKATIIKIDEMLGLKLGEKEDKIEIPENILKLVNERKNARDKKDWKKSDQLREQITKLGFEVKDTAEGQKIVSPSSPHVVNV
ncbi:MAG: cysteine--tRNA ligase [Patescibacteria group bacterium]